MAEEKASSATPRKSSSSKSSGEDFKTGDAALEAGYFGARPESEYDNDEYTLQSGASSPPYPLGKA
jgi:hypothetical protein